MNDQTDNSAPHFSFLSLLALRRDCGALCIAPEMRLTRLSVDRNNELGAASVGQCPLLDDIANPSACSADGIWVPFLVAARADEVIE